MERAADLRGARRQELAAWICLEAGKPWRDADADVAEAMDFCRYYAAEARKLFEPRRVSIAGEQNVSLHQPRGVAAVISPWNFPIAILAGMSAAALVTGNAVVMKPAEQTPIAAFHLFSVFRDAGVPAGVVAYLPGPGEVVGARLVEHPAVGTIAFTGSRAVGHFIARRAAETSSGPTGLKRVVAEMGGKNAIIVDEDADLDEAVPGVLASAFGYAGQKCSACSRVIAVKSVFDGFLSRARTAAAALVVGPADDPATSVGPLIDSDSVERVARNVALARETGRVVFAAALPGSCAHGTFAAPAVVTDLPEGSPILTEEIFGPVLAVLSADDFEHALSLANATDYALTGGVYSRSPRNIDRARNAFDVGNLYVNRKITGALVGRQPFGGFRHSGMGHKAGGPDTLSAFVTSRTITENTLRRGFVPE
jgi:RHH-type proline utilization regulon transcriptional repressor/proline dehydrogenase/delta 1-pyrroline-5-carboxylate dehydrogenase